jgi:hypothetical protein
MPRGAELGAHAKALFRARDQRSLETIKLISRQEPDMLRIEWVPFDLVEPESDDCKGIPLAWYLAPCTRENLKVKLEASIVDAARGLLSVQAKLTPQ